MIREAVLYKGTMHEGRMLLVGKNCGVFGIDKKGDYVDVYEPNHFDYSGRAVCFFTKRERQT